MANEATQQQPATGAAPQPDAAPQADEGRSVFAEQGASTEQSDATATQPEQDDKATTEAGDFKIPDEYADRGWAKKVKSEGDLYKQLDELDKLAGKKQLSVDDFDATNSEHVNSVLDKMKPESVESYEVPEYMDDATKDLATNALFEAGVPAEAANKALNQVAEQLKQQDVDNFSKEGLENVLKEQFGDKYEQRFGQLQKEVREVLDDKQVEMIESMPNQVIGLLFSSFDKLVQAHGARDGTSPAGNNEGSGALTKEAAASQITEVRKQLQELSRRPHTQEQKSGLVKRLQELHAVAGKN